MRTRANLSVSFIGSEPSYTVLYVNILGSVLSMLIVIPCSQHRCIITRKAMLRIALRCILRRNIQKKMLSGGKDKKTRAGLVCSSMQIIGIDCNFNQKATTKVCGCNRRFSRVCALAVGGAQATTRAILSGETCYKS